jgi:hypothetical protein
MLDTTGARSNAWSEITATSSGTFSIGNDGYVGGNNTGNYVAYAFAEVPGFSKFGSYTGNGSTDGPFVYTGFKPRYILTKRFDTGSAESWIITDTAVGTSNVITNYNSPNNAIAEPSTTGVMDILSNGFKVRNTNATASVNASG